MSTDLAALLVEEGAAPQADVDRALERQAEQGGAFDTALLELGLLTEGQLRSFLSHASGLPPPPPGALARVDPRARRVFPARVAERHRLAPFALDGRELSVVGVHPVDPAIVDEIGFMLSFTLVPHVAPEWQVLELIQRLYGGQLAERYARLAERSAARSAATVTVPAVNDAPTVDAVKAAFFAEGEEASPPSPEAVAPLPGPPPTEEPTADVALVPETPPYEEPPAEPAVATPGVAAGEEPTSPISFADVGGQADAPLPETPAYETPAYAEPAADVATPPSETPYAGAPVAADASAPDGEETSFADIEPEHPEPTGFQRSADEPAEPLLAALELAVDAYDELWADARPEPGAVLPEPPAEPGPVEAPSADEAGTSPLAVPAPGGGEGESLQQAGEPEAAEDEEPELPLDPARLDRSAPPRWSIDDARTALAAARHRDEVVLAALRFTRDIFEFSALFAVARDTVVGHDALGLQEDARSHCRGTAIYAEDPGIVRTVLETRAPYLGPVARDAVGTTNVLDGLWRGTPRTVLLYPILVGERPVAILYADNGEAPVSARRLGELLLFLSTVGGAFERIIRRRKKGGRRGPTPPAVPAADPPGAVPDADGPDAGPAPDWMAPPEPAVQEVVLGMDEVPPAAAEVPGPPAVEETAGPVGSVPPAPIAELEEAMALLGSDAVDEHDRATPIVDLLLDARPEVSAAAREAVGAVRLEAAAKPVAERLRRVLLTGVGERPALAAQALGALRDVPSIPTLIQSLESGAPEVARAATEALSRITLQVLGATPQKWLRWWKENRGRSRDEWLFSGLTSPDRSLRILAAGELRAMGEPPLSYDPDASHAQLDASARAWWTWWSTRASGA